MVSQGVLDIFSNIYTEKYKEDIRNYSYEHPKAKNVELENLVKKNIIKNQINFMLTKHFHTKMTLKAKNSTLLKSL